MKFCILAAGRGTRNTHYPNLHKALIPLHNKPAISILIDKTPKDVEIVVVLGYLAEQVESYLKFVHHDRKITFVYADFDSQFSGPGYSLLQCKPHLQEPFIFTSVDTLIKEDVPFDFEDNWIGTAKNAPSDLTSYCTVKIDRDFCVTDLGYNVGFSPFIGMAGIVDYQFFWESLKKDLSPDKPLEVLSGLRGVADAIYGLFTIPFTWYDIGNDRAYLETKQAFNEVVEAKPNEAIFICNDKVVKFFSNKEIVSKKMERSKLLEKYLPTVTRLNDHMFGYQYIQGRRLSDIPEHDVEARQSFWKMCGERFHARDLGVLRAGGLNNFISDCVEMYQIKTFKRLEKLHNSELDAIKIINGKEIPSLQELVDCINWTDIFKQAIPYFFHGDFQPENLIYSNDKKWYLIDWRESFGNSLRIGDMYYDLAKLHHALFVNGEMVRKKRFRVEITESSASIGIDINPNLIPVISEFKEFCFSHKLENWYDTNLYWRHIELLSAITYLNISSMHYGEYSKFLFLFGKLQLHRWLKGKEWMV